MEEVKGVIEEVSSFAESADGTVDFAIPNTLLVGANKSRESYMSTVK